MSKISGKVVVLELNEITWDLMDPLMKKGLLPNFQAMAESGARADAWASEEPEHLDPWVTWTTLYTGVPQEKHGLTMLEQDRETVHAKRIWEILSDRGRRIGIFGSANTWPPQQVDGFWIPGPFSQDYATYPKSLEPVQMLNVGLTRGHAASDLPKPSLKKLLPQLMKLGLRFGTLVRMGGEMVAMKRNPKTSWKKIALQPLVNLDLFAKQYSDYKPDFATLHSNHCAYYMHRFWRAMDPSVFEVPPTDEERAVYGGCIEYGYRVADEILGRLRKAVGPNVNIVVLSSCGQQPATGGRYTRDQLQGNVGLQVRIKPLLEAMGLADKCEYSNLMAPQWKLDFEDETGLQRALELLNNSRNTTRDVPAFAAEREGMSICMGANRNQGLEDKIQLATESGPKVVTASDVVERHAEVAKSGRHHPKGVLLMAGPDVKRGVRIERCDNLDIAPTLLALMGESVPDSMEGRTLEEVLVHAPAMQEPVPALA